MSCDHAPAVHRSIDIPAPPTEVWSAIVDGSWLGPGAHLDARPGGTVRIDGRIGVVEDVEDGRRLGYVWTGVGADAPPSRVDIEIEAVGDVTRLWLRETQLDLDLRSTPPRPFALARA